MATNFYKQKGSYYTTAGQKILNPTELQGFAKAGGKEISAPVTPTAPNIPAGKVAIPGVQYDTREKQQSAFTNIEPVGNTLYGIPINTTIPTDKLGEGSNIPPAQPVFGDVDAMMKGVQTGNEGLKSTLEQVNTQLRSQPKQDAITARMDSEAEANKTSQRDLQEQTWERFGLGQNTEQLQALMPQIAKTQAEYDQFSVGQEGRVASASSIYGRQSLIQRQKAVELAGLSAVAQAYQGNVDMARNIANDAINAQYTDQLNYMDNLKVQLDTIKDDLSREDQARATSLELMINERERNITEEKETKTAITNLALEIARLGVDSGTVSKILKAETEQQAIEMAVKSGAFQLSTTSDWTKIGEDANGNDLFYDKTTGQFKNANQLSSAQLGIQVGTIMGLPAYDTRSANPGMVRSDRNNNPGNIKASDYTKEFDGVIGVESNKAEDGGNFLIFDNPEDGLNAIGRLLLEGRAYQGVNAETAIKKYNGGGAYGARDVGLDPNGDFQTQIQNPAKRLEVARKMAMAEGWSGGVTSDNGTIISDAARAYARDVFDGKITISNVPQDIRDETMLAKEELMRTEKPLKDQLIADNLTEKINNIDNVINNFSPSVVGTNYLTRMGVGVNTPFGRIGGVSYGKLSGASQEFIAGVEQLIQQETIDKLVQSKAAGATYGALSDGEREMLASSASKVGTWRILDKKGKVIGYNINESAMKKELENIKRLAEVARDRIQGSDVIEPQSEGQISDDEAYNLYLEIKNQ